MAFFKIKDPDTGQWVNLPLLKGDKGDKGLKGDTGAKGDKGDPGEVTQAELDAVTSQLADTADNAAMWRAKDGNPTACYPVPKSRLYPRIELVATQEGEGDPSPENVRAILPSLLTGQKVKARRTGKNLMNLASAYIGRYDGGYSCIWPPITPAVYPVMPSSQTTGIAIVIPCKKGVTYTMNITNPGQYAAWGIAEYANINDAIGNSSKTVGGTSAATVSIKTYTAIGDGILVCTIASVYDDANPDNKYTITGNELAQVETSSVATPYEPYSGADYDLLTAEQDLYGLPDAPVIVDAEAGTVTVQDARVVLRGDEVSGVFVAPHENGQKYLNINIVSLSKPPALSNSVPVCSHYKGGVWTNTNNRSYMAAGNTIIITDSRFADIETANSIFADQYAAGTPVVLQYKLVTPITIPITPPVIAALERLKRTEARQNVLTVTANDSTVGVQKQTVTYQKSPIRESDEIAAAIAALA